MKKIYTLLFLFAIVIASCAQRGEKANDDAMEMDAAEQARRDSIVQDSLMKAATENVESGESADSTKK